MASETPSNVAAVAFRGVYNADPENLPAPPDGARAVVIRDRTGAIIGCAWVIAEHADRWFTAAAWEYLDFRDSFMPPAPSGPQLVR